MYIITGDSWGVSEFNQQCNLHGPGFAQFLSLHCHDGVVQLAQGASSNSGSLDRLSNFFSRCAPNTNDMVYWIVTCPSRCMDLSTVLSWPNLYQNFISVMSQSLARANELAKNYNISICVIGGLSDLDSIDFSLYPFLNLVVPSWGKLLDSNYNSYPLAPAPPYLIELGQKIRSDRPDLLEEWITIIDQVQKKNQSWRALKHNFFSTDGQHPDRNGHKKLRDFLFPGSSNFI